MNFKLLQVVFIAILAFSCNAIDKKEYQTPDKLWGDLYQEVEKAGIFIQPKTFWDAAPIGGKALPVLKQYEKEKNQPTFNLKRFVETHFVLPDYSQNYATSNQSFESYIFSTFDSLLVKPKDDGGSLIPTRMRYLSGGGMFNEYNYFESFFAVKAFQSLKEDSLASQMATNAFQFIQDYGYVPYGNRSYYLHFSGFPVLSLMAEAIAEKQPAFIPWFGNLMARDYQRYMATDPSKKSTAYQYTYTFDNGKTLNRFFAEGKENAYLSLDKTTEWYNSERYNVGGIPAVLQFLPIDLNAALFHYEKMLAISFDSKGKKQYADSYKALNKIRKELVNKYMFNTEKGYYYDYNFNIHKASEKETIAGIFPVLVGMANEEQINAVVKVIENDLLTENGIINEKSGNLGSAEMNYLTILALRKANRNDLANLVKHRWIEANKKYFAQNKHILPTYNMYNLQDSKKEPQRIDGAIAVLVALLKE